MKGLRVSGAKNINVRGIGMEGDIIFHFEHTFASAYVTGGEAVDFSGFMQGVDNVIIPRDGTYEYVYDRTNKKIMVYSTAGVEVAADTDLSAVTCYGVALGH